MKRTLFLCVALCMTLGLMACGDNNSGTNGPSTETPSEEEGGDENEDPDTPSAGKTLIVYYSYTNNTHTIVTDLQTQIEADVIRIEPAEKGLDYAADNYAIGSALISAIRENPDEASSYPAIDPVEVQMDEYVYKPHHTNQGIKATGRLSVNVVDEELLPRADYVGIVSGAKTDKSNVFEWHLGEGQTPVIEDSPLVMECEVVDNYETETFDNFICKINATHVEEDCLNADGKVDYNKLKPVLFEMPTYSYLRTGEMIGKCTQQGKKYRDNQ